MLELKLQMFFKWFSGFNGVLFLVVSESRSSQQSYRTQLGALKLKYLREVKHEAGWLWLKSMKSTDCDLC